MLKEADDGTDNGRYRSIISELSKNVLGVAGGFTIGDVGGADIVESTGIPIVNEPSGETGKLPTVFDMNPPFARERTEIGKYRYLRGHGASTVSMVYLAVDQSRTEADLQRSLMEAAGLQIVQVQELPLSTLSYDSPARRVANSGANYLFFIGDATSDVAMARAMADTGYDLAVAEYFSFAYGSNFIQSAGAAAEGATAWLRSLPNEEAGTNPEMGRYVQWMQRVAPDAPLDTFAAGSWVSVKAFLDNLESLPGPISRPALVRQLAAVGTYDAGGMFGPIDLGREINHGCVIGVQVHDGAWHRMAPDAGFLC